MRTIRVVLVTNALGPPTRGNGTTVARWRAWLPDVGVDVTAVRPEDPFPDGYVDLIHGYHVIHGGMRAWEWTKETGLPLVLSLGGTDLMWATRSPPASEPSDAAEGWMKRGTLATGLLRNAALITGAFPAFGDALDTLFHRPMPYATVPRGVEVPDIAPPRPDPGHLRVLLPIGMRPVKDPFFAIRLFERVSREVPMTLTMLGPDLDLDCAALVNERIAGIDSIVRHEIPMIEMERAYGAADVVWNTSIHEGGSNALLEALAYGCAVYARDVPGNRDLLDAEDAPGTLFTDDAGDAVAFHRALLAESMEARMERVAAQRAWLRAHHSSEAEARALRGAYDRALGG